MNFLKAAAVFFCAIGFMGVAHAAAPVLPFTVTMAEAVNVDTTGGTPRIPIDVGGVPRYASYASGTGTATLTFNYTAVAGDVDLDGVTVSSPVQLNSGTIADLNGNPITNLTFTPPTTTGVKVNFPSLGMDFVTDADGRYTLNGTAYNDLPAFLTASGGSFSRASIGTYTDSSGVLQTASSGAPRFDWDPVTHAAKGILIEEARTNLNLYSEQLDNAYWHSFAGPTIVANAATAPDGTITAESITFTPSSQHIYAYHIPVSQNTTYTGTIWLRAASGTFKLKTWLTNTVAWGSAVVSNEITLDTNWQRVSVSRTTLAGETIADFGFGYEGKTPYNIPQAGTIYAWGAQLEAGAFPTSYIPTTTATVTRAADSLTLSTASGWFDSTKGTFHSQFDIFGFGAGRQYVFSPPSADSGLDRLCLRGSDVSGTLPPIAAIGNGSSVASLSVAGALTDPEKVVLAYSSSDSALSRKGSAVVTGVGYAGTARANIFVGAYSASTGLLEGHIQKLKYYPARVSDTQLQLLTQ